MKFAEIIRNTGLDPLKFEKSSNIPIILYDGKNRPHPQDTVKYMDPLFKENEGSLLNFKNFLSGLEKENIASMNVQVNLNSVILFYNTPRSIVFFRQIPPMEPLDYLAV